MTKIKFHDRPEKCQKKFPHQATEDWPGTHHDYEELLEEELVAEILTAGRMMTARERV